MNTNELKQLVKQWAVPSILVAGFALWLRRERRRRAARAMQEEHDRQLAEIAVDLARMDEEGGVMTRLSVA